MLGLRWQDVDLEHGVVRITVNLQRIDGKLVLVQPKTKQSRRALPLLPSLVVALHHHRSRQLEERMIAGGRWNEHDLVFCTSVGTPISPRNLLRSLDSLLKRAGLPHMRFHDLRHSLSSFLGAMPDKVHPKTVQAILGHEDITTTFDIYTHLPDTSTRAALQALHDLFEAG